MKYCLLVLYFLDYLGTHDFMPLELELELSSPDNPRKINDLTQKYCSEILAKQQMKTPFFKGTFKYACRFGRRFLAMEYKDPKFHTTHGVQACGQH